MRVLIYRDALRRQAKRGKGIRAIAARWKLGEIDAATFLRLTHADFDRMAERLMSMYRDEVPDGLDATDLAQEMRVEALKIVGKWDPSRRSFGDFIVWNTFQRGKKCLKKARSEDRNGRARYALAASRIDKKKSRSDPDRRSCLEVRSIGPSQEAVTEGRMLFERLMGEVAALVTEGKPEEIAAARRAVPAIDRFFRSMNDTDF